MAKVERPIPDELQNPVPHTIKKGSKKAASDAVFGAAIKAGSSVVSILAGLLAAVLILYSGYVLYDSFFTMSHAFSDTWDLLEYKPEIIDDGATPMSGGDMLRKINDDYRAWLTVYDTNIDYPVLQADNDLYYASHDIYGNTSLTGAIYLAADNDPYLRDSYNLVYGHHMDNKAMFGGLDLFKDESYFNSHREGLIIGNSGIYDIEFFAVATGDAYENAIYSVGDRAEEVLSYLRSGGTTGGGEGIDGTSPTIRTEVLIFDEAAAAGADKIIALSTCASASTNGRLIVFGKMIKRNILVIDAIGYEGIYDAQSHSIEAVVSIEEGTTITYSIDGGKTWTDEIPSITNVGEIEVLIRAENDSAGVAEATATLIVHPRPVTVTADNAFKMYGDPDPSWVTSVEGTLGDDVISYTTGREPGENAGTYPITPSGDQIQGNYIVTYVPGNLVITSAGTLAVTATGYIGLYDGEPHYAGSSVNITEGTTVEYSTDGGRTWSTEVPYIIEPGQIPVYVRATNPNYTTAYATAMLIVYANPVPQDQVNLTVLKVWNDNNNADGIRPAQLYMVLSGGGQARTVSLGAGNNWTATVTMPRYDAAGNEITYTWSEPAVAGYTGSRRTEGDVTTITNTRIQDEPTTLSYTLTINYRYLDGTPAAASYTAVLAQGAGYDVTSPVIQGYTASIVRVTGIMPGQNVEYTVIYIPAGSAVPIPAAPGTPASAIIPDMTIMLEDYQTPLGLGTVYTNIGDCFE